VLFCRADLFAEEYPMSSQLLLPKCGTLITPAQSEDVFSLGNDEVITAFKATGAIVFKGFGLDVDAFEQFTNRFSADYMDNKGSGSYRETVNAGSDGTIQNVAYIYGVGKQRTFPLPLHADRSYVKSQPPLMWFLCRRPAAEGGQTTICDGVRVYESLSDRTRELFETQRIKYVRHYRDGEWQVLYHSHDLDEVRRFCDDNDLTLKVNADRSIDTEFLKPAVVESRWGALKTFCNSILIVQWQEDELGRTNSVVRLEDGSRIPDDVLKELEQVTESLTENIPWETGDFAMVDNTRMLHGRRAFDDDKREIYVRMCRSVEW
jgi:alpha-ketoglutarate-dependent taurine dioxygenase